MVTTAAALLGLVTLGLLAHRWFVRRGVLESRAQRELLPCERRRAAWTLTSADDITPIRPGTRSARGATTRSSQGTAPRQHKADPEPENTPGRHAAAQLPVHPALLLVEQAELQRAGVQVARKHPSETFVIHGRQGDRRSRAIVN